MNKFRISKKINFKSICIFTFIIGCLFSLIYIFKTSTAMLTSDSVITDVIVHQQKLNKQIFLTDWYYGNEFWFFALNIPVLILSFVIKNVLLLRQVSVLITGIIFFILLYRFSKKFLDKQSTICLMAIFASGISYSVLDYFYSFNAYLTVLINAMFLLLMYYKCFEEKNTKTIYFVLASIFTFLFNMGSVRYLPLVVIPFFLTELIIIIIENIDLDIKELFHKNKSKLRNLCLIIIVTLCAIIMYKIFKTVLHFEDRATLGQYSKIKSTNLLKGIRAIIDCVMSFFGYNNLNNSQLFMMSKHYFLNQNKEFFICSLPGLVNFIKLIISILFMIIMPIKLYKNFKKLDKSIKFLLIFNTISWMIMLYLYLFTNGFFYNESELKYFLFNISLNLIIGLYFIFKFWLKKPIIKLIIYISLISYILSCIYSTVVIVYEHNSSVIKDKYELVNALEENNLTFGYAYFWDSLLTNFLSNYKIESVGIEFGEKLSPYKWYSNKKWYEKGYHTGRTFFAFTNKEVIGDYYIDVYVKPDEIVETKNYKIYIYNKNPFDDEFYKKI